jgi:hypothetical protein
MQKMMRQDPNQTRGPWCYTCDQEKHGGNHWFEVHQLADALIIRRLGPQARTVTPGHSPVCGEGCLSTLVSHWMSEKTCASREQTTREAVAVAVGA